MRDDFETVLQRVEEATARLSSLDPSDSGALTKALDGRGCAIAVLSEALESSKPAANDAGCLSERLRRVLADGDAMWRRIAAVRQALVDQISGECMKGRVLKSMRTTVTPAAAPRREWTG